MGRVRAKPLDSGADKLRAGGFGGLEGLARLKSRPCELQRDRNDSSESGFKVRESMAYMRICC